MIIILIILGMVSLGIAFLSISFIIVRRVDSKKKMLHLPQGLVTYADLHSPAQSLFSSTYRLTGKPDFILKDTNAFVPVEYKSGRYETPPMHHVLQVAAYCQLIEDTELQKVPFGWIVYPTGRFKVPFSPQLRVQFQNILDEIRMAKHSGQVVLNHNNPGKCRHCSFRKVCSIRLSK